MLSDDKIKFDISIVSPSFNQGLFLKENLLSIQKQKGVRIEHILIDGGSTDETLAVIGEFGSHLCKWVSEKDDGQTDALIRGFTESTSEILGWLNSDDFYWDDTALAVVVETFKKNPDAVMVTGDLVYVDVSSNPLMIDMIHNPKSYHFKYEMPVGQPATFFRRSAYFAVGGLDRSFNFAMDFDLFQRISELGPIIRVPIIIAGFRVHPLSKTSSCQTLCQSEYNRCLYRATGKSKTDLITRLVILDILIRSLIATCNSFLFRRKLPIWKNVRLHSFFQSILRRI